MFILDFTVAKEAWEGNFLGELMARYDIAYDSRVVIDETLLEQLKQSRFIAPPTASRLLMRVSLWCS